MKQFNFFDNEEERAIDNFFKNQKDDIIHSLVVLSIDNFNVIHSMLGYGSVRKISDHLCAIIKNMFRGDDIVVNLRDDEFVILIKKPNTITDIEMLTEKIVKLVASVEVTNKINLSASAGVAVFPFHGTAYSDLKTKAYQAMYRSKAKGTGGYRIYDNAFTKAMFNEFALTGHYIKDYNFNSINSADWDRFFRDTCFSLLYNDNDAISAANSIMEIFCLYYGFSAAGLITTLDHDQVELSKMYFHLPGYENKADLDPSMRAIKADMAVRLIEKYGEISYVSVKDDLDEAVSWYMEERKLKNLMCYAVRKSGELIGAAIFETAEGLPTRVNKDELDLLHEQMSMIQGYLFMAEFCNNKKNYFSKLELLDHIDATAYIIDANNFELEFLNKKALAYISASQIGSKCYEVIRGNGKPCDDCPLLKMDKNNFNSTGRNESYNNVSNTWDVNMFSWFSGKDNKGKALVLSVDVESLFE